MKILVSIKQVLDSETDLQVDELSGSVRAAGPAKYWMNHADEFAVEEAILIKESRPGTVVDALTVGPERAAQVLERSMGMGADHGLHIVVPEENYIGPMTIASWIAAWATEQEYDLILTGVMAEDDMRGQVGPMIAELMSLPYATSVIHEELRPEEGMVYVEREIEGGQRELLELQLPAVLTIQTGLNRPRYPTLSNLLRAKKEKARVIDSRTFSPVEDREKILRFDKPRKSRVGEVLEGSPQEKAAKLLEILKRKAFL